MDNEDSEHQALLKASNTKKKYYPSIMVSIYHRKEDIVELPLLIKALNKDYKLYMRHHLYIPAWETNLYGKK